MDLRGMSLTLLMYLRGVSLTHLIYIRGVILTQPFNIWRLKPYLAFAPHPLACPVLSLAVHFFPWPGLRLPHLIYLMGVGGESPHVSQGCEPASPYLPQGCKSA
jgi:hypothetical protein